MESIETAVKADQREQAIVSAGTHVISEPQDHSYPNNITQIMKAMHSAVLAEDFQTRESLLSQLFNHCVENPSLLSELSLELLFVGADDEAFRARAKVLSLDMDNRKYWSRFQRICEEIEACNLTLEPVSAWQLILLHGIRDGKFVADAASWPLVASVLHKSPEFVELVHELEHPEVCPDSIMTIAHRNQLFLAYISRGTVADIATEELIRRLRSLCLELEISKRSDPRFIEITCAIAHTCRSNEFVIPQTIHEKQLVEQLEQKLGSLSAQALVKSSGSISLLACYKPLANFDWISSINRTEIGGDLDRLLLETVDKAAEESRILGTIDTLTPITNSTSLNVQSQYEANPYPVWNALREQTHQGLPIKNYLESLSNKKVADTGGILDNPNILIAGCGTGKHSIEVARGFANQRVTAIDLCRSSLAFASRMRGELNVANVDFFQADITELHCLREKFAWIESVGTLHHCGDAEEAWSTLRDLLLPNGIMRIGLYSARARSGLKPFQRKISDESDETVVEEILRLRREVITQTFGEGPYSYDELVEITTLLGKPRSESPAPYPPILFSDFFSTSGFRDLLLHEKEQCFNLSEISNISERLELEFLGFELSPTLKKDFINKFGEERLTHFQSWETFEHENPRTFSSMYTMWFQAKD